MVCTTHRNTTDEQYADAFARALLMPIDDVCRRVAAGWSMLQIQQLHQVPLGRVAQHLRHLIASTPDGVTPADVENMRRVLRWPASA